jgi:hypothetical protein
MMLLPGFREAGTRSRSHLRNNCDRSRRGVSRFLAGSLLRSADRTSHRRIAGGATSHSPIQISCGASQCEAEHGIGRLEDVGRGSAEVISAIGIVSVPLYLFRWNANVFSIFSAFCVDVAVDVLDFGRVAVSIIATADGRIVGHVPR